MKIETNLLEVILSEFSMFAGGEIFFGFLVNFVKFEKKISKIRQKSKKNLPAWKLRELTQNHPKKVGFNFHRNRKISFGSSIFTVQALLISYKFKKIITLKNYKFILKIQCEKPL